MRTTLYIGEWRVDQSDDEGVNVVSSVLDISDITVNKADFTKSFTVPATKRNNILFRHWYDANLDNSFDARVKVDGRISIDGIPFKIGKFRLTKVGVKKNNPAYYTISFFGNLANLKTTVGKDELTSLDLSALDHDYTHANVNLGLQVGGLFSGDIIYNLLAKKQYYFNDDATDNVNTDTLANISYGGGDDTGVTWNDLKPSIKLIKIIEAIESEYTVANGYENPIVFSRDFFGTSEFTELYLWLNPDKDGIQGETEIIDWSSGDATNVNHTTNIGTFTIEASSRWEFEIYLATNSFFTVDGILSMYVDGIKTLEKDISLLLGDVDNHLTLKLETSITSNTLATKEVYFELTSKDIFVNSRWVQKKYSSTNVLLGEWTTYGSNGIGNRLVVSDNFPKMKIIDFLKGLFNAFKLIVVAQDDGTIYIDTLNSYYASGNVYDVSRYIDYASYDVERGQILNEIELKFQEPTTILNIQFEKNNNRGYGDEELKLEDDNGKLLDGESLTFTLPFEQIVYERLTDQSTNQQTNIQYGAIIGEDLEAVNPKAHIFYNLVADTTNSRIGFIEYDQFPTIFTRSQLNALINTPYHHYGVTNPTYATIFKNEFSTWDGVSIENNLYSRGYSDYVSNIFNIKKRTWKYTAQLPIHIVTKLELNDTLVIKGNYYRIDKYSYNLLTGKSELTLINNFETSIGQPSAKDDTIYSDYIAKTEVTQVTNLQASVVTLVDNGWGTTWATPTTSNNNLEIALDEFDTTNGDIRSIIIRTTGTAEVADVYLYQSDKGYIPSFDFSVVANSQNIALINLRQ